LPARSRGGRTPPHFEASAGWIDWIEDALAPLRGRISEEDLRRLIYGIGATLGIEAFVWLTDIAQLSREDAAAIMRSNALGLLRSAIADSARNDT
jgi:hypothetical protein